MRIIAPAFLLGVCIIFSLRTLPSFTILLLALLISVLIYCCFHHSAWLLAIVAGMLWSFIYAHTFMEKPIAVEWEDKPILVVGHVIDLPVMSLQQCHFVLKTCSLRKDRPQLLKLTWYNTCPQLIPGQTWQLMVKLKQPRGLSNPGGMDFQAWAIQQGVSAIGYVMNSKSNKLLSNNKLNNIINQLRYKIMRLQQKSLPPIDGARFIPALTIGDRQTIRQGDWEVLQNTGTNHLVAIAGLHIGLVTGLLFFLIRKSWCLIPRLALYLPAQQAAALLAMCGALFYGALAGFALPTRRALIMLTVFFLATFFKRRIPAWHSYSLALFFVVLIDPTIILSMSFWLSFMAVGVIIYTMTGRIGAPGRIKRSLQMQCAVSIGVLPCTLLFFQKASFISPLVNAIVVPIVGLIVIPLGLTGSLFLLVNHWLAIKVLALSAYTMQAVWWILSTASHLPYMAIDSAMPTLTVFLFFCVGLFLLLSARGFPFKSLSLFLFLPFFFIKKESIPPHGAKFTLLDVGQGLASVLQTEHHVLLFDTGPGLPGGFNAGDEVVVPYLRKQGIRRVDLLIISHGDNDHAGGAAAIIKKLNISEIRTSVPDKFPSSWRARHCYAGQHWMWDGVIFTVLSPNEHDDLTSKNDHSCVLRVQMGQHAILLTGDIEKNSEEALVRSNPTRLRAEILQVPHHGSRTSSTPAFIRAVNPQYALFAIGYHNRFHFPANVVIQRYEAIHAKGYDTASSGALTFLIWPDSAVTAPLAYREIIARWWRS